MSAPSLEELARELSLPDGKGSSSGRLKHLAACLEAELEARDTAPAAAAERDAMRETANLLQTVLEALAGLQPGTQSRILKALDRARRTDPCAAILYDTTWVNPVFYVPVLRTLADALDTARKPIDAAAIGPGRGNLHVRLHGNPLQELASGCVHLIRDAGYAPDAVMVLNAMAVVWHHVTGCSADRHAMHRHARQALVTACKDDTS